MTARTLTMVFLALWLIAFAGAFLAFWLTPARDFGLTAGLNRISTFLGWQAVAGFLAVLAWTTGTRLEKGTGLRRLSVRSCLGARIYDGRPWGRPRRLRFSFFHLTYAGDAPERWRHLEEHPSDGSTDPIEFEFYWVRFPAEVPQLHPPLEDYLCALAPPNSVR